MQLTSNVSNLRDWTTLRFHLHIITAQIAIGLTGALQREEHITCKQQIKLLNNFNYPEITRSELRRYDRRCGRIDKLLIENYELLCIKN